MMDKTSVLITDDHRVVRDGISSLLELQDGIEVVGEASNGLEAVELVDRLLPDVVLLDLVMPKMDGIEDHEDSDQQSQHSGHRPYQFLGLSYSGDSGPRPVPPTEGCWQDIFGSQKFSR